MTMEYLSQIVIMSIEGTLTHKMYLGSPFLRTLYLGSPFLRTLFNLIASSNILNVIKGMEIMTGSLQIPVEIVYL